MLSQGNVKNSEAEPKWIIVVDDLIAPDKTYRKRFIARIGSIPAENFLFASNYEEANKLIKSVQNIVFGFIDCIIPKDDKEENSFEVTIKDNDSIIDNLKSAEWGIKIIAENPELVVFPISAHLDARDLEEIVKKYSNAVKSFQKPLKKSTDLNLILDKYISPYFPKAITVKGSSTLALPKEKSFDYSSLDSETVSFIREKTKKIRKLIKRTSQDIIDIGNYLLEVKSKLGHGNFYNWLDSEFNNWSYVSISRFMSVANRFESNTVKDLEILPSALYELAPVSVPEEAIAEALEIAKSGKLLDKKTAVAIKTKYKILKEQAERTIEAQVVDETGSKEITSPVPETLPSLPENKIKQKILSVVPSRNPAKNSWWQLGEHNKLFCGEAKSHKFLNFLPEGISLGIVFLTQDDFSIPPIKSPALVTYRFSYEDLDIDEIIEVEIRRTTEDAVEIVVFGGLYYIELLDIVERLKCHYIIAEPDLRKCEQVLARWRSKGEVKRIKY